MKVIFLDIDGVMNDELSFQAWGNNHNLPDPDIPSDKHMLQLKRLVDLTGAEIVLSSSWRCSSWGMQNILERFNDYNLRLYSITAEGVSKSIFEKCGLTFTPRNTIKHNIYNGTEEITIYDRGAEILDWMLNHDNIESFVVLDDETCDIVNYINSKNIIKTNPFTGLTDADIEKSIWILNK